MSNVTFTDNKKGTVIKRLATGEQYAYDILVGRNIPKEDSILDYCYNQYGEELTSILDKNGFATNEFCSGTCVAMALAIVYGNKTITPKSVLLWGDETNEDGCTINWTAKGLTAWEQDNYDENHKQMYDNRGKAAGGNYAAIDGSIVDGDADKYLQNIKAYLSGGIPVIIELPTHYVVVVGVESNVPLDAATLEQLVIFDPAWKRDDNILKEENKIITFGESKYSMHTYRMITPYPIVDKPENDNNEEETQKLENPDKRKLFVADENGNKTHDPYYIDPVTKADGSIIPAYAGRSLKAAIEAVNNSLMSQEDKEEKVKGLIKLFTGEGGDVYKHLTAAANGEYLPGEGVTAFNKVTVNVPLAKLGVSENGEYHAEQRGVAGFDTVTVNVPDRYAEGYNDGVEAVADDIASGGGPVSVPDNDSGSYSYPDGAVPGVSPDTAGKIAVRLAQADGETFISDPAGGVYVKCTLTYNYGYHWWMPSLELYNARTGEFINHAACSVIRDGHGVMKGEPKGDDVRISEIEIRPGDRVIMRYRKYNPLPEDTEKTEEWAMIYLQNWMFPGVCIASGSAPVYISNN